MGSVAQQRCVFYCRAIHTLEDLKDISSGRFQPKNREEWRAWLIANHASEKSVWLVYSKKNSALPTITYSEAVDEALCFGWIDSTTKSIDAITYRQYFTRRKVKSVWSRVNKEKIKRLISEGRMAMAGMQSIEAAKQNGSWTALDDVENLLSPDVLKNALNKNATAAVYFENLSRTDKRNILQWLAAARLETTISKRVNEIIESAAKHKKPKGI